jgi:hypothetical protein
MTAMALPGFFAGQPVAHVDASLRLALAACDRAHECAVLWFAEIQRRELYRALGHAGLQLYATQALGFSDNRYWLFKRLADDLDRLPVLREAVATGEIGGPRRGRSRAWLRKSPRRSGSPSRRRRAAASSSRK